MRFVSATFWLFVISSIIMMIYWCMALRQFCLTSIRNYQQIQKTTFALIVCTCSVSTNTVYFLSKLYPDYSIFSDLTASDCRNLFEGTGIFIGAHIYRVFMNALFDKLYCYAALSKERPKYIQYLPLIAQMCVIMAMICFYSFIYAYENYNWAYLYYVILDSIALIIWVSFCYVMCKVWKSVRGLHQNKNLDVYQNDKIRKFKTLVKVTIIVSIIIVLAVLVIIFMSLVSMYSNHAPWTGKSDLIGNIVYTLFLITLPIPLLGWSYTKMKCSIAADSVFAACECRLLQCCEPEKAALKAYKGIDVSNDDLSIILEKSGDIAQNTANITIINSVRDVKDLSSHTAGVYM